MSDSIRIGISLDKIDTSIAFSQAEKDVSVFSALVEEKISRSISRSIQKSFKNIESSNTRVAESFVANNKKIGSSFAINAAKSASFAYSEIDTAFENISVSSSAALQTITRESGVASRSFDGLKSSIEESKIALIGVGIASLFIFRNPIEKAKDFLLITKQISNTASKVAFVVQPKGLFGLTSALAGAAAALSLVSETLALSENTVARVSSKLIFAASVITGGIAAGISLAILKIAEFGQKVSREVINFNINATDSFASLEKDINVFSATLEGITRNVQRNIGSLAEWKDQISNVSTTFNFLDSNVTKAAQEIALVGSKANLSAEQLRELLFVSADYAKVNQKDLFQTTLNIVSALNGQSQAAQALGIKLNQTAVQQFAYTQGLTEGVEKLGESEKVQLRYNLLLKQYGAIAGVGVIAANELGDQQNRLSVLTNRLNVLLGEGASVIERNNIVAFAFNQILSRVNESFVKAAGFASALGARLANVGFFILEVSFKIFALTKAISILNILLSSKLAASAFSKNLLIVGTSIDGIISRLAGQTIAIRSVNDVLKFFRATIVNQLSLTGKLSSANSLLSNSFNILSASILKTRAAIVAALTFVAPFLITLAKIGAAIGVVVGFFAVWVKAFQEVERRTEALSGFFNIFKNALATASPVFLGVINFFSQIKESAIDLAFRGFGFLVDKISSAFGFIASILAKNPLGAFSRESVAAFNSINAKVETFRTQLSAVAFDIRKIPEEASRAIAGIAEGLSVNLEELARALETIKTRLVNFGLSQQQIITQQEADELKILDDSFANKLLSATEYERLRVQVKQDAINKLKQLEQKNNDELARQGQRYGDILNNGFVQVTAFAFETLGASLNRGASAFESFGANILAIIGDIAIQLGTALIAKGLAIEALRASLATLSGGAAIAAGAGLIALGGLLKSFGGAGLSAGGSGGNDGAQSASEILNTPTTSLDTTSPVNQEREREDARVQLVVQGNYIETEEGGAKLVDLISSAFNKRGVVLTDARFA